MSQLAAREDENKKLRGELKRRKTEGRTVFEMEGEASRLRKELETLQATTAHQLELKDREQAASDARGGVSDPKPSGVRHLWVYLTTFVTSLPPCPSSTLV